MRVRKICDNDCLLNDLRTTMILSMYKTCKILRILILSQYWIVASKITSLPIERLCCRSEDGTNSKFMIHLCTT